MRPKLFLGAAAALKNASRPVSSSGPSTAAEAAASKFRFSVEFDPSLAAKFRASFLVHEDFVTAEEEAALMAEVEPHLGRLVYEKDHWDEVRNIRSSVPDSCTEVLKVDVKIFIFGCSLFIGAAGRWSRRKLVLIALAGRQEIFSTQYSLKFAQIRKCVK